MMSPPAESDPCPALAIVPARSAADFQHVRALFGEYAHFLQVNHGEKYFEDFQAEMAALPGAYAAPGGCLLLACGPRGVAGCVALRKIGAGLCEMKRLYVRPGHRGQGVGRLLAQAVITEARRLGHERMRLDTLPAMAEAVGLYRSLGFVEIGPYGSPPVPGALYLELVL
jgi:GNAT superfamily N-acetyltransferase